MNIGSNTNCEKIVDVIIEDIMHGKLLKGEKLPTERRMAEDMGVSRASVREALKSMESMGITMSIQGSGTYITSTPEMAINRPLCALFALSQGTIENVMQLRIVLETAACWDIIETASDERIKAVCELCRYDYINLPVAEQTVLDARFHESLVKMSNNSLVKYLYITLSSLMDVYREKVLEETYKLDENKITREGHYAICDALTARDTIGVGLAIKEHLELTGEYREALVNNVQ
ncbi:MAG: GntR family transcriptional regulator [Oscillospiraceae bacterium]